MLVEPQAEVRRTQCPRRLLRVYGSQGVGGCSWVTGFGLTAVRPVRRGEKLVGILPCARTVCPVMAARHLPNWFMGESGVAFQDGDPRTIGAYRLEGRLG
ncbi:hypothetical protein, partial [Streptomyces parvus]|uniref:hypothetical protein n=1 Tax=Streptomyces parvus TaxID=66428 RepID=UPI001CA3B00F